MDCVNKGCTYNDRNFPKNCKIEGNMLNCRGWVAKTSLTTDSDNGAEVTLDCVVKILATELAETWWTAVYFERDNMSSFDAEKAGEVKATTEYEHFIPQAEKLLERIKF